MFRRAAGAVIWAILATALVIERARKRKQERNRA